MRPTARSSIAGALAIGMLAAPEPMRRPPARKPRFLDPIDILRAKQARKRKRLRQLQRVARRQSRIAKAKG